jgi:MFS family permease
MVGRRGPRIPLAVAGVCLVSACLLLTGLGPATPTVQLIVAYVAFGTGLGFVNAPVTNAAVSGMPRAQAGVAAAIATTSRQVGQTLGVAVVGATAAAWWVLVGCGAVVLALGLVATGAGARRTAASPRLSEG